MRSSSRLCHRFFVAEVLFAVPAGVAAALGALVLAILSAVFFFGSPSAGGLVGTYAFLGIVAGGLLLTCTFKALSRFVRLSLKYFDSQTGNVLERSVDRAEFLRGMAWATFPIIVACMLSGWSVVSFGLPGILTAIYLTGLPILVPTVHLWIKISRRSIGDIASIF